MVSSRCERAPRKRGFTLIEIMVVVFILGLLVTLVAPRIVGRTDEARRTKRPRTSKAWRRRCTSTSSTTASTRPPIRVCRRWSQAGDGQRPAPLESRRLPRGGRRSIPWGNPYAYLSDGNTYTLKSYGADGAEGGEGKYADIDSHTAL